MMYVLIKGMLHAHQNKAQLIHSAVAHIGSLKETHRDSVQLQREFIACTLHSYPSSPPNCVSEPPSAPGSAARQAAD